MGLFETIQQIDKRIILWINERNSEVFDFVMYMATETLIWLPFFVILLYMVIRNKGRESILVILFLVVLIFFVDGFTSFVKDWVERPRPTFNPSIMHDLHLVNEYRGGLHSFFSSHASNSFGVALFFSLLVKDRSFSFLVIIWALVHSYTRLYLGVHYLSDVLVGAIVGLGAGYLFYQTYYWSRRKISLLAELRFDKNTINYTVSGFKRSDIRLAYIAFLINLSLLFIIAFETY